MGCAWQNSATREQPQFTAKYQKSGDDSRLIAKRVQDLNIDKSNYIAVSTESLHDVYRLGKWIGEGAFGSVSVAFHRKTRSQRAVKTIRKTVKNFRQNREQFLCEMGLLKKMDHPNIVGLFEVFEDDKGFYLITELWTGGELFDYILEKKKFSEATAAHFMKQILSAINYCHRQGVVHRDLKPENLLLESHKEDANLKVIDFGTSALITKHQRMQSRLGTPYYTAPEILCGSYDNKVDIWSCGVIMYIFLCGYPPFNGENETIILAKAKEGNFEFPDSEWSNISQSAKHCIRSMLNQDAKKRPTAQEVLNGEWITTFAPRHGDLNEIELTSLNHLKEFRSGEKFQSAILTFIASQIISSADTQDQKKVFMELDANGDGQLSREELLEGYLKIYGSQLKAEEEVDRIMAAADTDKSGFIDYTEWLVASLDSEKLLSKKNLELAFSAFDKDSSGSISIAELKSMIEGIGATDEVWADIVKEVDADGNGEIDIIEFREIMLRNF